MPMMAPVVNAPLNLPAFGRSWLCSLWAYSEVLTASE